MSPGHGIGEDSNTQPHGEGKKRPNFNLPPVKM